MSSPSNYPLIQVPKREWREVQHPWHERQRHYRKQDLGTQSVSLKVDWEAVRLSVQDGPKLEGRRLYSS